MRVLIGICSLLIGIPTFLILGPVFTVWKPPLSCRDFLGRDGLPDLPTTGNPDPFYRLDLPVIDNQICGLTQFFRDCRDFPSTQVAALTNTLILSCAISILLFVCIESTRRLSRGAAASASLTAFLSQCIGISVIIPLVWFPSYLYSHVIPIHHTKPGTYSLQEISLGSTTLLYFIAISNLFLALSLIYLGFGHGFLYPTAFVFFQFSPIFLPWIWPLVSFLSEKHPKEYTQILSSAVTASRIYYTFAFLFMLHHWIGFYHLFTITTSFSNLWSSIVLFARQMPSEIYLLPPWFLLLDAFSLTLTVALVAASQETSIANFISSFLLFFIKALFLGSGGAFMLSCAQRETRILSKYIVSTKTSKMESVPYHRHTASTRVCSLDTIIVPELLGSRHRDLMREPSFRSGRRLALRFQVDEEMTYHEVTRADVFKMVQMNVDLMKAKKNQVQVAPETISTQPDRRLSFTGDTATLHMRDIRKLDNIFAISQESSLTVRKQVILVNAEPIRAVILKDLCLIFLPDGADSLISMLKQAFKEANTNDDESNPLAFEFRALEAILATLTKVLSNDCEKILPIAKSTLDAISTQTQTGELETLRKLKNIMSEMNAQVNGIRRILFNALEDEVAMHSMYLTKLFHSIEPLKLDADTWSFDSDYVESMLESYMEGFYGQQTKIELVLSNIQNTESIVMMKLDSMRNSILTVDLSLTTMTAFVTISTFITGAFGMNLDSTIQEVFGIFYLIFGVCFVFPFLMYVFTCQYLRKRGIKLLGIK